MNIYGVYLWENTLTGEIVFIGMASKVKMSGQLGSHSIENSLVASKGRINGLDTQNH